MVQAVGGSSPLAHPQEFLQIGLFGRYRKGRGIDRGVKLCEIWRFTGLTRRLGRPERELFSVLDKLRRAGTFAYHSHTDSAVQELRGRDGFLIVLPRREPAREKVNEDFAMVLQQFAPPAEGGLVASFPRGPEASRSRRSTARPETPRAER